MAGPDIERLAISVNGAMQEYLHARSYKDLDRFGFRLSQELALRLSRRDTMPRAVFDLCVNLRTTFFRLNRLKRAEFASALIASMRDLKLPPTSLRDELMGFKRLAERQFVQNLLKNRAEENIRSLLQAYLGHGYATHREVETGRGRIDILVLTYGSEGEVIETKVWDGRTYHKDGIKELCQYLNNEGLARGSYVVLDYGEADGLIREKGSETWTEIVDGKTIEVLFVRVPTVQPSKLGLAQRKAERKAANG